MSKKDKSPYDENGRWVEERSRVKGAIRRVFRLSPQMKEALHAARVELPPALKKDGKPGVRKQVRYRCAVCGGLFSQKHIQVDHINPVVPLWMSEADMSYDDIVRNIICDKSNLQVICSIPAKLNNGKPSCHRLKTNEENFIRDYLAKIGKENFRADVHLDEAKAAYQAYLKQKEEERKAKEARKLERLLKKKKNKKGEQSETSR
jgi:hypothetical protein